MGGNRRSANPHSLDFRLARPRDGALALLFVLGLVVPLALGFTGTGAELWRQLAARLPVLPSGRWADPFGFLLLASLFAISLPARRRPGAADRPASLWLTVPVPVLVALAYGALAGGRSPLRADAATAVWYLLAAPLGEELLFRGWLYAILTRLGGDRRLTLTSPLPLVVWLTALAFSLWHLQSLGRQPTALVAFQVLYTFFTGLWLGYLRWRSQGLLLPVLAHVLIDVAAALPPNLIK